MADERTVTVEPVVETPGPSPLDAMLKKARTETVTGERPAETPEVEDGELTRPESEAVEGVEAAEHEVPEGEPEPEAEPDPEDGRVAVELPAHFKEHNGRDSIRVAPEDEDILRGLVGSFEAVKEREAKAAEIQQTEEALYQEVEDFRLELLSNPLAVMSQALGDDADMVFRTYLLNNPPAWQRFATWFTENAYDEGALRREMKDAQVELRERRLNAQLRLQETRQEREVAVVARNEMTAALESMDPAYREFAQPRMQAEIRQAIANGEGRDGVARIVADWRSRFGKPVPQQDKPLATSGVPGKPPVVSEAERKQEQAKKARTVRPSGAPTAKPKRVTGQPLDAVIQGLKSGAIQL